MAFHLEQPENEFQREVKQTLIDRVASLESQLHQDVETIKRLQKGGGVSFFNDAMSQHS